MSSRKYTPEKINGTSEFAERQIGWQLSLAARSFHRNAELGIDLSIKDFGQTP